MTMQTDLFHGPQYWWAAYCRRWRKMTEDVNIFSLTATLIAGLVLLNPSPKGWLIVIYWLASLQVCYDDNLSSWVYRAWAVVGLVVSVVAWSSLGSELLFMMIQVFAIVFSLMRAYIAHQRRHWTIWWSRFTYREFDPGNNQCITAEELRVKFGLGSKSKPSLRQVQDFLVTMRRQGYISPQQTLPGLPPTWLELNIGNSHRVSHFLQRGVVPPSEAWTRNYIDKHDPKHKLLVGEAV